MERETKLELPVLDMTKKDLAEDKITHKIPQKKFEEVSRWHT